MKVLVTGANGFVGSWLTRQLIEDGHEVRILCRPNSDLSDLEGLEFQRHLGDICDIESLKIACHGVDTVFHLAGVVGYSKAQRALMEKVNVEGTRNVVDACEQQMVQKLIYMSSVVAVGASFDGKTPLNEGSPYNVEHLDLGYFQTKKRAEEVVLEAAKSHRIEAVALNPSTIYGPGDAKKGSRKVQLKVAQGKFPYYTSGGVSIISVKNVVQATLAAWRKGRNGERYILSGDNITIKELFSIIALRAGVKTPYIYLPNWLVHGLGKVGDGLERVGRKGPINSENAWTSTLFHWFDNSKAKSELDLNPLSARQAIHESVDWIKDNGWLS